MATTALGAVGEYITTAEEYLRGDRNVFQDLLDDLPVPDREIINRTEDIFGRLEEIPEDEAYRPIKTFVANLYMYAISPCLPEIPKDEPRKGLLVHGAPRPPLQTMMGDIFVLVVRIVRICQENHNVHFFRRLFKIELDKLEKDTGLKK